MRLFEKHRASVNNGSPYKTIQTSKGREIQLESVDVIGMVLWHLKSKNPIYKLCPVFGVVPSTASVWIDYGLEVMSKVIEDNEFQCLL